MTTQTTTEKTTGAPAAGTTTGLIGIPPHAARALATGGGILTVVSTFLAWTWTDAFPATSPSTATRRPAGPRPHRRRPHRPLRPGVLRRQGAAQTHPAGSDAAVKFAALATFTTTWYTVVAITVQLGGLVNLEPGGYVAAVVTLLTLLGALALPFERPEPDPADPDDTGWEQFRHRASHGWQTVKAAFASGTPARCAPCPPPSRS